MISALNGGGFGSSLFQQVNQRLYSLGSQATRAKMEEVKEVTGSSNFGAGTTLGTGKFHQTQSSVVQNGTQSASRAAQQYAENMNPESLRSSRFQQANRQAQSVGGQVTYELMQQVKDAYATSHPVENLGRNVDIAA